jgi:molybdate transport system regulatory protein
MGLSYKRAWLLIETMNACFTRPVIEAAKGGKAGGGARLTPFGEEVLARYRRMQAATDKVIRSDLAWMQRAMRGPRK